MSRPRLSKVIFSAIILVCLVLAYYISACLHDFGSKAAIAAGGRLLTRQDWPQTLVDLIKDAEQHHIKVGDIRVYQMSHDEYYWKFDSSSELFSLMSKRWELSIVKSNDIVQRFQKRMPTSLLWLSHSDGTVYNISANWLTGEKGDLYCVMTDKSNKAIIVRYYYNF